MDLHAALSLVDAPSPSDLLNEQRLYAPCIDGDDR